jgi:hypothetical protein
MERERGERDEKVNVKKFGGSEKKFTDEMIAEALANTGGLKAKASRMLGCSLKTILNRLKESEQLRIILYEIKESMKDKAEFSIQRKMEWLDLRSRMGEELTNADLELPRWYLKLMAKDRGYVERQEVGGFDGAPLDINVKIIRSSKELKK